MEPPPWSPSGSPSKRHQEEYSDRFIPSRRGVNLQDSFALLPDSPPRRARDTPQDGAKDDNLDDLAKLLEDCRREGEGTG